MPSLQEEQLNATSRCSASSALHGLGPMLTSVLSAAKSRLSTTRCTLHASGSAAQHAFGSGMQDTEFQVLS